MGAIKKPKDFLTGLLFAAVAIVVITVAQDYKFGTPRQMGPGFFPIVLAVILLAFAAILVARSLFGERDPLDGFAVRPAVYILGSGLLFNLLLRPAGLIVAVVAMVAIASQARRALNLAGGLLVGAMLAAGSAILFVYLLGQNLPLLGTWFGA
jgi:hypothetical protein